MIGVLVVDDDFMVARVHAGFVGRVDGFTALGAAHSGAQALQQVEQLRPDLLLLDVYLPDITGLEVLAELRQRGSSVDALVVSAARDLATVQQAFHGGAVGFLVKPFDQLALTERLQEYASRRRHLDVGADQPAEQGDIDRLFTSAHPRTRAVMPKGLTSETAELVRTALRSVGDEGISATECAEATGLARVSARRYLEHLVDAGEAAVRQRYGVAGRPQRRFHRLG